MHKISGSVFEKMRKTPNVGPTGKFFTPAWLGQQRGFLGGFVHFSVTNETKVAKTEKFSQTNPENKNTHDKTHAPTPHILLKIQ